MAITGKTADPKGMSFGNLTSHTTWEWLVKDENGSFIPTGQVVDMDAYDALNLAKRAQILNHKEVELEMDGGIIIGFHCPSANASGGVAIALIWLVAMTTVVVVIIVQRRGHGQTLGTLYFLSLLFGGKEKDP